VVAIEEKVAIVELRGGTHLLLLEIDQLSGECMAQSSTGQFHQRFSEQFDLMIKGKGLNELKKYRLELISRASRPLTCDCMHFFGGAAIRHPGAMAEFCVSKTRSYEVNSVVTRPAIQ
jgi:hypothetical protein